MSRMAALKFLFLAAACVSVASAHPEGAPKAACQSLSPGHGTFGQSSAAPYKIAVKAAQVAKGEAVEVTISGNDREDLFKGFMIQARDGQTPRGSFRVVDPAHSQTMECEAADDTITQKRVPEGMSSVTFEWVAPADFQGQVKFTGSIVKTMAVFWTDVESAPVAVV